MEVQMKFLLGVLLASLLFLPPQPITPAITPHQAQAMELSPQLALEQLFTTPQLKQEWFAPSFLNQIPLAQLEQIIDNIKNTLGSYQEVEADGSDYLVIFEQGSVPTKLVLDVNHQISGLLFQPPISKGISLKVAQEMFRALPGKISFLVLEDDSERVALKANQPLAVGSAFKLAVLKALRQQIDAGILAWDDVVELKEDSKSLPSGILQTWPDGSQLTVQTLATLMISVSDNTATDILINLVGRELIESFAPRNRPFLSTREAFVLKNPQNQSLLERYRQGDEINRRELVNQLQSYPLPSVDIFSASTVAVDVEWFFTTRELCQLMATVADLPLMSINPGVARPNDWSHIAFKGGSEPGVFNLTTRLEAKDGKTYCVAATWNNTVPLDETQFTSIYLGAIAGLIGNPG
ncbi:MAG: serine hydrolase [Symploca sp. SIO1A3]|nr:serine hydrolase [Symploca sp. SIO1A3]